jgi:uncharacterized protein YjiS (DUF1127 family)
MATSLSNEHSGMAAPPAQAPAAAVLSVVANVGRRLRRWAKLRADRRQLMEYPDHMLRDIGISRSEIDSALRHGRHGRPLLATGDFMSRSSPQQQYIPQSRRAA